VHETLAFLTAALVLVFTLLALWLSELGQQYDALILARPLLLRTTLLCDDGNPFNANCLNTHDVMTRILTNAGPVLKKNYWTPRVSCNGNWLPQ
jgi:hypothetical protein